MSKKSLAPRPEWPTLGLILANYLVWAAATIHADVLTLWIAIPLVALTLTLHSSLQHEVTHGHPLANRRLSEALVYPPIGLLVPYPRFRDLHLAHHQDANLTDPYDDPETNYLDPAVWARLPGAVRRVLLFNNTLLGRIVIGPLVGTLAFVAGDWRAAKAGDVAVIRAWTIHAALLVGVAVFVLQPGAMPVWAYLAAAYLAMSILKIRTFLEHQAHERVMGRSVIIEDRGPLAFLFLNNNLHAVHHAYPGVAWYRLPALFAARRSEFLRRNVGYRYASYAEILRRHLLRRKDPVPHPEWPSE